MQGGDYRSNEPWQEIAAAAPEGHARAVVISQEQHAKELLCTRRGQQAIFVDDGLNVSPAQSWGKEVGVVCVELVSSSHILHPILLNLNDEAVEGR